MASVAKRLGTTAMALYRYVDSRQELEMVMADVAIGPAPAAERAPRLAARASRTGPAPRPRQLRSHPWTLELRTGTPPVSPNLLAWTDSGMQVTLRSGLTEQPAASALLVVDGFVRSQLLLALQFADPGGEPALGRPAAPGRRRRRDARAGPGPGGERARRTSRMTSDAPLGAEFEFGLVLVLDGIAALAAR